MSDSTTPRPGVTPIKGETGAKSTRLEAKKRAIAKVRDMLSVPENLERLDGLRAAAAHQKASVESQLKGSVESQLGDASKALASIAASRTKVAAMRRSYTEIDSLCTECRTLINAEEYAIIKRLSRVRGNVHATLAEIRRVKDIPVKIAEIRRLITEDDRNILEAHERMTELEAMRSRAQSQAERHPEMLKVLQKAMAEIEQVSKEFDARLWAIFRNLLKYADKQPWVLVRANQVIERQEFHERGGLAAPAPPASSPVRPTTPPGSQPSSQQQPVSPRREGMAEVPRKDYPRKREAEIKRSIEERFTAVLGSLGEELIGAQAFIDLCFPSECTRVLTNFGFAFLDEIERHMRQGEEVLYAAFDVKSKSIVYRRGVLVYPNGGLEINQDFIEFTDVVGRERHWAADSAPFIDEDAGAERSSSFVSLLVTPEHEMYVQGDNGTAPRKRRARKLLSEDPLKSLRFAACAANGFVGSDEKLEAALGDGAGIVLETEWQKQAFVELYFFWMGASFVDVAAAAVKFNVEKPDDVAWLKERFGLIGLEEGIDWTSGKQVSVSRDDIVAFFKREQKKVFASWVWHLGKERLRPAIDAFHRADGTTAQGGKTIFCSSPSVRDDLVVLLLRAGYAAHFVRRRKEAGWAIEYVDPNSASGEPAAWPSLARASEVTRTKMMSRTWCVTVDHPDHLIFAQRAERAADGVVTKASKPIITGQCNLLLDDLTIVYDKARPCFPPGVDVFKIFATEYHKYFYEEFQSFDKRHKEVPNSIIIAIVTWVYEDFERQLIRLGMATLEPKMTKSLLTLESMYNANIKEKMYTWVQEVIKRSHESKPRIVDGQLLTTAPVDLFDIVNAQIAIAKSTGSSMLVAKVVAGIGSGLVWFQRLVAQDVEGEAWRDPDFWLLVATVNDANRCYERTEEVSDSTISLLDKEHGILVDLEPARHGFHELAEVYLTAVVKRIFADVEPALAKLFTPEWVAGKPPVVERVVACFNEYFTQDLDPCTIDTFTRRIAAMLLDSTVSFYLEELLTKRHDSSMLTGVAPTERLASDEQAISTFFSKRLRKKAVDKALSLLSNVRELFSADRAMIPFYFDGILKDHPDVTVHLIAYVLSIRNEHTRDEVRSIMEDCSKLIETRLAGTTPQAGLFTKLKLPTRISSLLSTIGVGGGKKETS